MSELSDRIRNAAESRSPTFLLGVRFSAHEPWTLAATFLGISVAVLVMYVELGFLLSVLVAQAHVAALLRGDLVVMSASRTSLHDWSRFDRVRLEEAAASPQVAEAIPIYESGFLLRNPPDRSVHRIVGFGFPPKAFPLNIGNSEALARILRIPNTILFDRASRPLFGTITTGQTVELDGRPFEVGGTVSIGPDIMADGTVVMSEGTWLSIEPAAQPVLGLIRLKPGSDIAQAERDLTARLQPEMTVMTPREVYRREIRYTLRVAPIGFIFGIGLIAGLVIGAIVCYQALYNQIIDHAKEYATLRAMGFTETFFRRIVLEQSLLLATGGLLLGSLSAAATYHLLSSVTGMPIALDVPTIACIAIPTIVVSAGAALMAHRDLLSLDPAELY